MSNYFLNAAIKGVLEGLTEFLPVSSTGHLVLVRDFFPLTGSPLDVERLDDVFDIVIQFPAILAIVILYWKRLWTAVSTAPQRPESRRFLIAIVLAFIPAAIAGVLLHHHIEKYLMFKKPIAIAFIIGGIVLILIERMAKPGAVQRGEDVSLPTALAIGCFQCFGMIPGTSRSGATIVGGRLANLNRAAAAEFSFFLAIPTIFGAFVYKMGVEQIIHPGKASHINWDTDLSILLIGSVASFVSAWIVVALFIKFLQKHSLAWFGWYRIILGLLVLYLIR